VNNWPFRWRTNPPYAFNVALRERQQTQGRTSIHRLRQIMRVVKFWREYISDQSIESIGNKELSGYVRMVTRMYPWRELHESRTA
jgi:hypothetical protein